MRSSAPPTLVGSTTPRLSTPPLVTGPPGPCGCGCALTPETSKGFAAVDFARDVIGIELIPWQRWLLIHALELRPDGRFRFRTVLILVARQNGKTTIVEIKNLWKMFVLQVPLVIGTAQNLDISEESWDKAVDIAESIPELAAEIAHVDRTNGKKALRLVNGARWKIAAASRKGGRGLSGDDVNLDELREHQTWESWAAVTKTTMARRNPQVYAFSNAGDDKSVVLNDLQAKGRATAEQLVQLLADQVVAEAESITRAAAAAGIDTTLGLFEWSAPDDVRCTCARADGDPHTPACRLQDRQAWAQANPSLGYTVTEEGLASALATDPEGVFRTECLCQRVPNLTPGWQVIGEGRWRDLVVAPVRPADPAFAVVVNDRRTHSAIAAAGVRPDGRVQLSIVDYRPGTAWVPARMAQLQQRWEPIAWAVQDKGPTGSLLTAIGEVGITAPADPDEPQRGDLAVPWAGDVAAAYGLLIDAVDQGTIGHLDERVLNAAVEHAQTRPLSGATAWDYRHDADVDSAPLVAVILAHWAYVTLVDRVLDEYRPLDNIW